jgi:flagellar protein FlaJ
MSQIDQLLGLIDELETQLKYKRRLVLAVMDVEKDYQKKRYNYSEYDDAMKEVLKGKTLKEWADYYNSYCLTILERIKFLNTQIFYSVYNDKRFEEKLKSDSRVSAAAPAQSAPRKAPSIGLAPVQQTQLKQKPELKQNIIQSKQRIENIKQKLDFEPVFKQPKPEPEQVAVQKKLELPELQIPKKSIFENVINKKTQPEKEEIAELKKRAEKPQLTKHIGVESEGMRKKIRLFEKKIVEKEYFKAYTPSVLGTLANRYFRTIGESIIESNPQMFEKLFKSMRFANIKVLSKTYVNIMLFTASLSFISVFLAVMLLSVIDLRLYTVILRPIIFAVLISAAVLLTVYFYPFIKAKQRAQVIDANLPFAINHMSAVATSGLPPDMMFRIVSKSREYKELSAEFGKLSEYMDAFGYDLTTAIQSVSATTPSRSFKEFLDGALATLTSGGDFGMFLSEKSEQSMFAYKLKMEKYNETVSTYSDIYMGIMIVAPVFLIAVLSLVSILGGTIFGIAIDALIVFGTYVAIPFLNVAFLTFLEVSQPAE